MDTEFEDLTQPSSASVPNTQQQDVSQVLKNKILLNEPYSTRYLGRNGSDHNINNGKYQVQSLFFK